MAYDECLSNVSSCYYYFLKGLVRFGSILENRDIMRWMRVLVK